MKTAAVVSPKPERRRVRRLLAPLVAPPVFDFWAARVDRLWTWERPLARLVERRRASADAMTLVLRPNRHWTGAMPGQHVNVAAEIDGARVTRSYSPTVVGRHVEITVKAVAGGRLSAHLCRDARIGAVLDIGPAFGAMTLPALPRDPLLFLAAGSGITPLMALTRALAARGMPAPLTLVYWARTREELCFADELGALAEAHPRFDLRVVLTRESGRRIEASDLVAWVRDLPSRDVFACGPGGFVERARAVAGARAKSFVAEAFTPPAPAPGDDGSVEVTLLRSRRVLTLPRGESLLTALETAGLKPASGCRMGICNTCACGKRSGATRNLHTGALDAEPVSALRLCVSAAASDLALEL